MGVVSIEPATTLLLPGSYTVQDGGANPLSSIDGSRLIPGTFCHVSDLGGCGVGASPGSGLVVWLGEWRRFSRGVTCTVNSASVLNIDALKDPMRFSIAGSTVTSMRVVISRPFTGGVWSFTRSGVLSTATAVGVGLASGTAANDIPLLGPAVNFVEYQGMALAQVPTS